MRNKYTKKTGAAFFAEEIFLQSTNIYVNIE
jgi:hypothetical protein